MNCFIIPDALHDTFEVKLHDAPCRTGLVKIYSGPNAGSWAANAAIFDSCPEWAAVKDRAMALNAQHNIQTADVDLSDLVDPNAPKIP